MRVHVETVLPCSVDQMWEAIQSTALLREVSAPLVTFEAVEPRSVPEPERWTELQQIRLRPMLFGRIPLSERTIEVEFINTVERVIQTNERDALVRHWQHRMAVQPAANGRALYSDTVEIDAGPMTFSVWVFAQALYRHRHRRWRKVAERLNPSAPQDRQKK